MAAQPTLRLTQTGSGGAAHTVELEWLHAGPRQTASATVSLTLSEQDQHDIRWYVEEFPEYPFAPNPERAARVEARMRALGHELFRALFAANERTTRLWAKVADRLDDLRVEVVTDAEAGSALPWELLRDPVTDTALALHAQAFVRAAPEAPRQALALEGQHVIRILLVICRPKGDADVPFRSVAARLLKSLSAEARQVFRLDVLRPPTFARLAQVLHEAKARGEPYHVVHFDGHGVYGPPERLSVDVTQLKFRVAGPQGFLLFESGDGANPQELIHGSKLGDLLVQNDVPLLVLNACRSAHAERPQADEQEAAPSPADNADAVSIEPNDADAAGGENANDPVAKVRAFGSLAQQVMLAGVGGVVAMRYNVYVVTAAQFVAELYRALVQGLPLGEAVTRGRKHLHAQPVREIVERLKLEDWLVPVVYEAEPMQVFAPLPDGLQFDLRFKATDPMPRRGTLDPELPAEPDVGFFGRDETLLALDRAFDRHSVVLLHAYAGSGKTSVAAEFARWYSFTGGVDGPVLFSDFQQRKTLAQLLDQLGLLFNASLRQSGIDWQRLTDPAEKRDLALQILRRVPVLWLWDNVEPVAGFPADTPSAWTASEQRELADFLRAARGTRAKFLLASRRDERGWLGELPARVRVPPMPLAERRQLAEALAAKHGRTLDQAVWRPLLQYSEGNPLTLTVVVSQALRDGLRSAAQLLAYVQRLRAGEAAFADDQREGRSRSLGASLEYGFATAFTAEERVALALLHHFQGFVDVGVLRVMGDPSEEWHVPAVAGLTREAGIALLDRAAEVGLLTAFGGGYYSIHPALPWFLRRLFDEHYPAQTDASAQPAQGPELRATRAYVEAMGELGNYYHDQYGAGNREVIGLLRAEEANLLHALRLARQHGWYRRIISAMQGLDELYGHTGRRAEWRQLVDEIVPLFVDPATDGPRQGHEAQWSLVTGYRVRLLREQRQWTEAARLQALAVEYNRQQAAPLLALPLEQLDRVQRNALRLLAVSVEGLGHLQREQGAAACVDNYQEAMRIFERIGAQTEAATIAFNLGRAYSGNVPELRDLAQAEAWYRRALDGWSEGDLLNRGKTLGQLGTLAHRRFQEMRQARQPNEMLGEQLNAALRFYHQQLELTPPDVVDSLAVVHNQLGNIYGEALPAYLEQCVAHYRESIRYEEQAGNRYGAARTRHNVAIAYLQVQRLDDALLWARAALRGFEQFGPAAADRVARAQEVVAQIEAVITTNARR